MGGRLYSYPDEKPETPNARQGICDVFFAGTRIDQGTFGTHFIEQRLVQIDLDCGSPSKSALQ
jgi:hypothetical protein